MTDFTRIKLRGDTAAQWTSANPTLALREPGYETDTGYLKIGDGSTAWSSLNYLNKEGSTAVTSTSNSVAIDSHLGNVFTHTMTENTTFAAPSNVKVGEVYYYIVTQDASTAYTLAYNAVFKFTESSTIDSALSSVSVITAVAVTTSNIKCTLNADNVTKILVSKETKTDAYPVTTSDFKKLIDLGSGTVADKTFTLPSVGTTEDGDFVYLGNDSDYLLTIAVSDTDHVWNSGAGYGLELPDKGTIVGLRYDHTNTKWDVIYKAGGLVRLEGLVSHFGMDKTYVRTTDATTTSVTPDITGRRTATVNNDVAINDQTSSKFPPACFDFSGTDEYIAVADSTDWDIFGNQTGHKTVSGWVYIAAINSTEPFITHFEDNNNRWYFRKHSDNSLEALLNIGGVAAIEISGGSLAAVTWYHVAMVVNGAETGLYLDGVQVAYDATFATDTFAGSLLYAFDGNAAYSGIKMQDWHVSRNNPYGAAPNVGVTDTFTKPASLFQGVMK